MSDDEQPETDAEYLTRRHWIQSDTSTWMDPLSDDMIGIDFAVATQSARDEQEARVAWVRFAAAILTAPDATIKDATSDADHTLVEYRARFGRKVAP